MFDYNMGINGKNTDMEKKKIKLWRIILIIIMLILVTLGIITIRKIMIII